MIPRFPNGATQHGEAMLSHEFGRQTRGTETSHYPQEKKTIVIPQVVASERGIAQTHRHAYGGCGAPMWD